MNLNNIQHLSTINNNKENNELTDSYKFTLSSDKIKKVNIYKF